MKKKTVILVLAAVFAAVLALFAFDMRLKTVHYSVKTEKEIAPFRVVFISDLHCCKYGKNQNELIEAIRAQNPDYLLLGGDIFDDKMEWENSLTFLKAVGKEFTCFYVTGNHEVRRGVVPQIKEMLAEYGITVLDEQRGNFFSVDGINFIGFDDKTYLKNGDEYFADANAVISALPKGFNILLMHRPEDFEQYIYSGIDLMLSGHAHGGQWRIPFVLNGLYAPGQGLFPQYAGGKYSFEGGGTLIVSRGLARESTNIPRIFNRPEILVIDIE